MIDARSRQSVIRRNDYRDLTPERVQAIREAYGQSQEEFAETITAIAALWTGRGVTPVRYTAVQHWEAGRRKVGPYLGPAILIAEARIERGEQ